MIFIPRRIAVADVDVHTEDEDVAFERQRVLSGGAEDDLLKMENLTKVIIMLNLVNISRPKVIVS